MPVTVLREIQHTDVLEPYPNVLSYWGAVTAVRRGLDVWPYKKRLKL